ncbi:MAG: type II secretion system secretin GspD [Burkholderia sp.]
MTTIRFAMRRAVKALVVVGIVASQIGFAQAQVTLNFVNADIDQVAKAIGAATGKTIIVDPRVKGQINLVSDKSVPEDQALKTLQSALRMQGFSLLQDHGVLKVVPEADAKLQGVPTYVGNTPRANGDQIVTQVFELHNESANNLLPVLRPLISPNNTVTAYSANNRLVVTDYADNVRRIAQIIADVDNAAGTQVVVVSLRNANAIDVASQLGKLLDPGSIGNTDATLKVNVSADPRTNSILLRASNASRLASARHLLAQLDAPSGVPGNMHVVWLRNADALKLAKTLRGILGKGDSGGSASSNDANSFNQGGSSGGGSNFSIGTAGTAPLPSGSSSLSSSSSSGSGGKSDDFSSNKNGNDDNPPGGMIQADTSTNALIITASDPVYRNLRAVIDQLDERRAQVYIEGLIVELNSSASANLGIQWQVANNGLYAGSALGTGLPNLGNSITTLTQNIAGSGPANTVGQLSGLNIGWLKNMFGVPGLGALLQAFSGTTDANVLSTPNLVTLDNEEAKIVVGQNVPIATGSYSNLTSGTGNSNAFNTFDREDVGLTLHVKPQITDGGILKLQIYTEDSSVVASATTGGNNTNQVGVPIFNKRSIQSTVLCDNGEIIVLGGLMQDNYQVSNNKVPLLGDIPWIGQLFRSEGKTRAKTNLMIFLRPVILSDPATTQAVTANRYDYIQGVQATYKSDNNLIRDKDDPVAPPMPLGPREGGAPASNLFDLTRMTRTPGYPATPDSAPANVPAPAVATPTLNPAPMPNHAVTTPVPMPGLTNQPGAQP